MSILRIRSTSAASAANRAAPVNPAKEYLERLVKLIPAEVVGIYLAGKSLIQSTYSPTPLLEADPNRSTQMTYFLVWTIFCLVAIIVVRIWATKDPQQAKGPQWGAVGIATVSFLVWVYSFGDIFLFYDGVWSGLAAGLLVLAWTFIVPLIYRGDTDAGGDERASNDPPRLTRRAWTPPESSSMRAAATAAEAGAILRVTAEASDDVKRFAVSVDGQFVHWENEQNGAVTVEGACGDHRTHRLNFTVAGPVGATLTLTVFCGTQEVLKLENIEIFPEGEPLAVGVERFEK
jgi:hypothetical protein